MQRSNELAENMVLLMKAKEDTETRLKDIKAALEDTEKKLFSVMVEEENDSFSFRDHSFSLSCRDIYSCAAGNKEDFISAMENHGYTRADIITETIPAQKLQSLIKQLIEDNDDYLPDDVAVYIGVFTKNSVKVRKQR